MEFNFKPNGVCSRNIKFNIDDNIVHDVEFTGGCSGNSQGVAKLCEGRDIDNLIETLSGIKCGYKTTSCPDQLAEALKKVKQEIEASEEE